jgi:diguanylate cyclase (GGDEF)-like protein
VSAQTLEPWAWEGRIVRRDGTMRWLQAVSRPERQGDGSTIWDGLLLDATRAREAEETIRWQAHPRRPDGGCRTARRTSTASRTRWYGRGVTASASPCASSTSDRFKEVNDTLGHALGDKVLRAAARRVAGCVRPGDTVARLGGDELTVLLTHLPSAEFAADVSLRIIGAFADPLQVEGHAVSLSCSVGLVMAVDPDVDPDSMLRDADTAMYEAKERGRGRLQLFNEELADRVRRRLSLSAALREALGRDEFRLVYQPQLDTATGTCLQCRGLLRWTPASYDPVGPTSSSGLAEELGLISGIGEWVIRSATRRAAAWRAGGAPRRVSVNVSAHQLRDGRLPRWSCGARDGRTAREPARDRADRERADRPR